MAHLSKSLYVAAAVSLSVLLSGCASSPDVDPREFERAETAVRQAREAEAGRHAAELVARAEERLAQARAESEAGNREAALRKIDEAAVLAERAETSSLAAQSAVALDEIQKNLAVLREQIN